MTNTKVSSAKPVRLQDVASAAGTSLTTASMALNGKGRVSPAKQLEIRRIAERLGFEAHPAAQRLATGRSSAQIELFTRKLDLGVATLKLQIIQGLLAEKGYRAPIHASGKDAPIELVRHLRRQHPLAMVCHAAIDLPPEVVQELQEYVAGGGCLVTFDLPIATHSYIPLTTVSQPLEAIAHASVELLTSRLEGHHKGVPRTVQLCGELIMRQSSAPLPVNSLRHTY